MTNQIPCKEAGIPVMKKLLLGTIGLVALSGSAMAADLAARPYKAPPLVVAPIYDWTGFYIGANGGWGEAAIAGHRPGGRRGHC